MEFARLRDFVYGCDANGVEVPNDSLELRNSVLGFDNDRHYRDFPFTWPPDELLEIMAFGGCTGWIQDSWTGRLIHMSPRILLRARHCSHKPIGCQIRELQ